MSDIIQVKISQSPSPRVPVINYGGAGGQLRTLLDVDATNLQNGYALVYVKSTDKFTIEPLNLSGANIDGGTY